MTVSWGGHEVTPDDKFWCVCKCDECKEAGAHRGLRHDPTLNLERISPCPTCGAERPLILTVMRAGNRIVK